MTKAEAIDKVRKLRALAEPGRGATPAEREVAGRKAATLMARFGLGAADTEPFRRGLYRPRRVWATSSRGEVIHWFFNQHSGSHSDNVKVLSHDSPVSWKIEINDERIGRAPVSGNNPKSMKRGGPWSLPKPE